jgi:capsular polysaccharide biosynthesis protein
MEQQIDDLARSIAATPATETALNALMRNRENIQTQYNSAIARRAEASTGAQIEIRSDGQRFSLLESAEPPAKPVSPNRRLVVALAGLGGLGAGLGFVALLEILNKTVRRPKELTMLLQYEPLGIIPVVRTRADARVATRKLGFGVFLSVGAVSALLIAVHYYQVPLDQLFQRLVSGLAAKGSA